MSSSPTLKVKIDYLAPKDKCPPVLKDVTKEMVLNSGEITWLLGPSGAGKTTFLRMLGGDRTVEFKGIIEYYYSDRSHYGRDVFKDGKVGLFLPDGSLPPWPTILDILYLPAKLNKRIKKPKEDEIDKILNKLRLSHDSKAKHPFELSLGMRYRILIALAFLYKPFFYLIDEIFSALDQPTADLLIYELNKTVQADRSVCLITTHDIDRALSIRGSYYYKDLKTNIIKLVNPSKSDIYDCFQKDYS